MGQNLNVARTMFPRITSQSCTNPLVANDLVLDEAGSIRVIYAPFDHIEMQAKLVVVGITPGMNQAVNALRAGLEARISGNSLENCLKTAKLTASFSGGGIRNNLVSMLDAIGVARLFGVSTTAAIFQPGSTCVHFTSALRYPVFVNGKNYNGAPDILTTPILRRQIDTHLVEEAKLLGDAVWLPLGPKAELAVSHLAEQGLLDQRRILTGLPHPSGANAERIAVFLGRKKPEAASRQTRPAPLLAAFTRLQSQIDALGKGEAA